MALAVVQRQASTSSSELLRLLLRSFERAEEAQEMENEMASASGRRARVQVMASSAKMAAARGLRVGRPTTSVRHAAVVF